MNDRFESAPAIHDRSHSLRVGYLPLTDAAPFLVAAELGLFRKYGLEVVLSREVGWATIRDKIAGRQLDAAHALGPMPFALSLGLGSIPCPCISGLVLNLQGNGITLSRELHERGATDAEGLRKIISEDRGRRVYTFAAVFPYSSHWSLLKRWLRGGGIDPEKDVKLVIVPPSLLFRTMATGHIDGCCVGEPWNTLAVHRKMGARVAVSADINPGHPEKVLMVRKDFHETRQEEHLALITALLEACRFCDAPENRNDLVSILARSDRLDVSDTVLRQSLEEGSSGNERIRFYGEHVNSPDTRKAAWITEALLENNAFPLSSSSPETFGARIFRQDIFDQALRFAPMIPTL